LHGYRSLIGGYQGGGTLREWDERQETVGRAGLELVILGLVSRRGNVSEESGQGQDGKGRGLWINVSSYWEILPSDCGFLPGFPHMLKDIESCGGGSAGP
jgi:hypothetical protein